MRFPTVRHRSLRRIQPACSRLSCELSHCLCLFVSLSAIGMLTFGAIRELRPSQLRPPSAPAQCRRDGRPLAPVVVAGGGAGVSRGSLLVSQKFFCCGCFFFCNRAKAGFNAPYNARLCAQVGELSARWILLVNSKSRNFNGFQSVYPGGTKIGVFFTSNQG